MKPSSNAKSTQRLLADSGLALLAGCVAIAMFLPPLAAGTSDSWPRMLAAGLTMALALPLHWLYLGSAVRRLGGWVAGWVGLAVLLFPVGGAAALLLQLSLLQAPAARRSAAQ